MKACVCLVSVEFLPQYMYTAKFHYMFPLSFTVLITFCELGPKLLEGDDVENLLSEAFSQNPLEP